jgi:hypothetical protein
MQITQLYIDGQRVDMFDDVGVTITDTIKDVRDISKVFTEYSQTFSLPASKTNNKLFKHYYNNDIQNGFDARIRVPASIELNSIPFKNGYIKLEGVDLKNNTAHTYRITFFGNTISLKNLLGDDLLSSLSWLDNFSTEQDGTNLLWNPTFVEKYLTTSVYDKFVDGVRYPNAIQIPLITHTQRLYYDSNTSTDEVDSGDLHWHSGGGQHIHGVKWNELKYALRLSLIIKAIEEKYGLTFSSDFFKGGDSSFDNLYMWLHRSKGKVTSGEQLETSTYSVNDFTDYTSYNGSSMENSILTLSDGYYFSNQVLQLSLINSSYTSVPYSITVFRDGVSVYSASNITGSIQNLAISVSNNSSYSIQITSNQTIGFDRAIWNYSYFDSDIDSFVSENYTSSSFNIPVSINFNITQQIPKMKVLDFLTSLFKMFNLVAYVEGSEMVVKTLDDFYDNPSSDSPYDITKYVDVNSSQVNSALPFREVVYTYKGLGTFLAKQHEQLFNKDWGKEEYKGSDGLILSEGIFKNEIPFEHMKFERLIDLNTSSLTDIQWGFCVDDNQDSYIGNPLIFYMTSKTLPTGGKISFVDQVDVVNGEENVATSHKEISSYYVPSNSDFQATQVEDRQSLNFSAEKDEWELVTTRESLFNSYHRNYISNVFDESNRLKKISAYLPLRILYKYTLADRFIYSGKSYKINSIETDFYTGKSEIELINDYVNTPIDYEAPTAPTNLQLVQGSETSTSFSITWTASTDNVGVVGYNIDLNQGDIILAAGNVTTYEVTGLSPQTQYTVYVSAFDASGNESTLAGPITANTTQ